MNETGNFCIFSWLVRIVYFDSYLCTLKYFASSNSVCIDTRTLLHQLLTCLKTNLMLRCGDAAISENTRF